MRFREQLLSLKGSIVVISLADIIYWNSYSTSICVFGLLLYRNMNHFIRILDDWQFIYSVPYKKISIKYDPRRNNLNRKYQLFSLSN